MRKGWTETTLGEIASFYNGKTYKQEELLDSGKYRVLRVGNFFSNGNWYWSDLELEENKYCDRGDLLYAWSASFGPRIWSEEKVIYHYHIWKIVEDSSLINKQFLYYWLDEDVLRMKRDTGNGSIMMHITKGGIEARTIQLPPLIEQKRIVDVMSSVDACIDALQQQVDLACVARDAVLHDLLEAVANSPVRKLKDLTSKIGSGATPRGGEAVYQNSGVTLIRSQNVHDAKFVHEGLVAINDAAASALDGVSVEANDVLINITGASVARTCLVDETVLPARVNQHVAILRTDSKVLLPGFLLRVLLGQKMSSYLLDISGSGTTRQAITKAQLESLEVAVPPISEQKRIVEIVSSMDELIQSTEQAVVEARALRSGLLSDLLSGNHEIPASYDSVLGAA